MLGLIEIRPARVAYRAYITAAGLSALRRLMLDHQATDPASLAHMRQELGLDTTEASVAEGVRRR
ncbi:hypothetical protein SAMN02745194_05060 [Roseomonas rosea]|uniref:Uncharacterized protein n=1 Tax=Muricoccus roseus TaxID=198092 RepID=A0A1M6T1S1_9PROT|nr:hypothetical protein [Roseomonas rosea]SHK50867.1 hypothetical protein SAMN02745194_05060 [Roseomonas rosea]